MVNRIKKLLHITFEDKARPRIISACFSYRTLDKIEPAMRSLSHAARKGSWDKHWLKDRVQYLKNGVMQYSITHGCFVHQSPLRVANPKWLIRAMSIGFALHIVMQSKEMLLKVSFKIHNIWLIPLILPEHIPRVKQVFGRND